MALVQSEEDDEEGEGACATTPTAIKTAIKARTHAFFSMLKQKPLQSRKQTLEAQQRLDYYRYKFTIQEANQKKTTRQIGRAHV